MNSLVWDMMTTDVVTVEAPTGRFRMGARFFTDQQVNWVHGLCRLRSGVE